MIVILMKHHGHTLQGAIDYVGELCRQTIENFNENRKNIPSWSPEVDDMVQQYITGLQNWIVGCVSLYVVKFVSILIQVLFRSLHWSYQTTRYFGADGQEVKKNRYVKLLPIREEAKW